MRYPHTLKKPFNQRRARSGKINFNRDLLPAPEKYYAAQGLPLLGRGEWRSVLCPFHPDTTPSLRVNSVSGGYYCMVCKEGGGDVLAFHMQRHNLPFKQAAIELGALYQ